MTGGNGSGSRRRHGTCSVSTTASTRWPPGSWSESFLDYLSRRDEESAPWREGGGALSTVVALSADEARALKQQWRELIAPFITRTEDHQYRPQLGQRFVRYFHAATPLPAIDLTETPDD
jgi:hypothetical protein